MTLLEEINSKCSPELIASKDYQALADIVNTGRQRLSNMDIGNGWVLETLGLTVGNALLDAIHANPEFRHVKVLLDQSRLNISSPLVQATLDAFVPSVLTQAQADSLKALGYVPDLVSPATIYSALTGGI
jgi:hypothetical protein